MALPLSRKSLVVESLDRPQPGRAGKARDVLPLFVAFQYFLRDGTGELLVDPTMLLTQISGSESILTHELKRLKF